ncbi:MAG: serine/threonine protein kinase [Pseudomonadota bacterium]
MPMDLKSQAEELLGGKLDQVRIVTDTTQFMDLSRGDVLDLQGQRFLITGVAYEGRFGLDEEPKHWVKRGLDFNDGSQKMIKLVFFEEFDLPIGQLKVRCYRSPRKEARILELVRGQPQFMQGLTFLDQVGNEVRVLDRIPGVSMDKNLDAMKLSHQDYFQGHLHAMLQKLLGCLEAIAFLHGQGERHGDIRRDHIYIHSQNRSWIWIDFDYNFDFKESPFGLDLFGLGNVLCYVMGRGIPTLHQIKQQSPEVLNRLDTGDLSLVIPNRVFNLKKIYPYLPEELNRVLMHFAAATPVYYERVEEIIDDLRPALAQLPQPGEEERP